jgi:alpha-L-fucosidase
VTYKATKQSLDTHNVPEWFNDAKLGIFIHWGLYSVPAYAPTTYGDINETFSHGGAFHFAHNPYAEWYLNSLKLEDGPYPAHHRATYGEDVSYDDFAATFNVEVRTWAPKEMARTFAETGARYVVLTTKHHDGFLLWPSRTPNPNKTAYHATRDIVGDLTEAVRAEGLRMGLYYSGALDWSFNPKPIDGIVAMLDNGPADPAYAAYADAHYYELIERYKPSILWNDIGYPVNGDRETIIAHFYNTIPEGVVNDRWTTTATWVRKLTRPRPIRTATEALIQRLVVKHGLATDTPTNGHYDFRTPEYASFSQIRAGKWECCRGLGRSFGYNRLETDEHHISVTELIHSFVDIVSKNGNLLLNVGPMANGTIPELQLARLQGLGRWLATNGEAIYGSRPWTRAEGTTTGNLAVRFTQKGKDLFAIVLGFPKRPAVTIRHLAVNRGSEIELLGHPAPLIWKQRGPDLSITLPAHLDETCALAFHIHRPG